MEKRRTLITDTMGSLIINSYKNKDELTKKPRKIRPQSKRTKGK